MTLKDWRTRIGKELVYRLDDELDAHAAFLQPRRGPGMPAKAPLEPTPTRTDAHGTAATHDATTSGAPMIEANAQLLARAQGLFAAGRAAEAERLYRQLLQHTHVIDFEYDEWLKGIAECYRALGRAREAGYVYLYLHAFDRAAEMFPSATAPVDAARVKELEARRVGGEPGNKLYAEAARGYAEAGRHVLVGHRLRAGGDRRARSARRGSACCAIRACAAACTRRRSCTSTSASPPRATATRRAATATWCRRSACSRRSPTSSRPTASATAPSTATASCSSSARTRASFENLAEGYINCIRVLKEDNLKFYVLQYYEDFLRIALGARGVPRRSDGVSRGGRLRAARRARSTTAAT